MNLQPINPPMRTGQLVPCCVCHCLTGFPLADMDGEPFAAYYCPDCAGEAGREVGKRAPDWAEVIEWPQPGAAKRGAGAFYGAVWTDGAGRGYFPVTSGHKTREAAENALRGVKP